MRAIMDAEWIAGQRTAAASGLVIKHLAKDSDRTLDIPGCRLQGRKHLEAVHATRPQPDQCVCHDLFPERQERFIAGAALSRMGSSPVQATAPVAVSGISATGSTLTALSSW